MIKCGGILNNIGFDCENNVQSGTIDLYVGNYESIVNYITNELNVITDFNLSECIYKIEGRQNSISPSYNLIKGSFYELYDHSVKAIGFNINPMVKKNLDKMKSGLFFCIVEHINKGITGLTGFEVYGLNAGLVMKSLSRDPNNVDTQGAFEFEFFTEKNKEPFMPLYLSVNNSYVGTKLFLENALCSNIISGDFNNDFNNDFN
jgi:hypothetical protein